MKLDKDTLPILWCLHGNLQQPTVWNSLAQTTARRAFQLNPVSLWETLASDCWHWADAFCTAVRSTDRSRQNYLLGYSLGGRLALHALVHAPELWAGAIIVSADPGTANGQKRRQALSRDRTWARRFLTEPWEDLLAEWEDLSVFCDRPCSTPRPETAFDRQKIAQAFEAYSKGHMDDLTGRLQTLSIPITYVTGADDDRYCQLGQALSAQCPSLTHITIDDAGHRVPWEQPEKFMTLLINAISLHQ